MLAYRWTTRWFLPVVAVGAVLGQPAASDMGMAAALTADPNAPNYTWEHRGSVRARFATRIHVVDLEARGLSFTFLPLVELHDDRDEYYVPVKSLPNEYWRGRASFAVGWQGAAAHRGTMRLSALLSHESDHRSYDNEYYQRSLNDIALRGDFHRPLGDGFVAAAVVSRFHYDTHTKACSGSRRNLEPSAEMTAGLAPQTPARLSPFASVFTSWMPKSSCTPREARVMGKAGIYTHRPHGTWQLFLSVIHGNEVGQDAGWTDTRAGLGVAWSP